MTGIVWNKLRFVGAQNVDLPIVGADPSGPFVLKGVDGLDPPPVDVSFANTIEEGGVRQARRTQNRQIVALIGLQPDWDTGQTSSELRTMLYGLLTPKYNQPAKAQIMLGSTVICGAQGDVSNIDASIFSKDPEVQVTLDCDSAYLKAPEAITQLPTRTVVGSQTMLDIENEGTAPTGFSIGVTLQEAVSSFILAEDSAEGQAMTIAGPFVAGDRIVINTQPRFREVYKIPSGSSTKQSLMGALQAGSPWLMLHGGANRLVVNVDLFDWYGTGFVHTPSWWGV